jgi:hypothetical protein
MFCTKCGKQTDKGDKFCPVCGEKLTKGQVDDNTKIKNVEEKGEKVEVQKLEGVGGWLALFGFGIFAAPIFILFSIFDGPQLYGSLDVFFNIVIISGYVWLDYLMIKKRKIFKKWFLGFYIFLIILNGLIALGANIDSYRYSKAEWLEINSAPFITLLYAVVWSLYLWNSKRVKNTFVN